MKSVINYHALTVAILVGCTVETAFEKLQASHPDYVFAQITTDDVSDMKVLKGQGMTYEEIAKIYGMSKYGVYNRLRRWEPKRGLEVKAQ